MRLNLLFTILATMFIGISVACTTDDGNVISIDSLPTEVKLSVDDYFGEFDIIRVERDDEFDEYEVKFSNGMEVDFAPNGEWTEIECKRGGVPAEFIPAAIAAYVEQNYPGSIIEKISRDARGYEIELNNDWEIEFDMEFNVVEIDR